MDLKTDVCSLEYAQKLKELGVSQNSPFHWVELPYTYNIDLNLNKEITSTHFKLIFATFATVDNKINEWCGFSCGMLFEILPAFIDTRKDEPFNLFHFHLVKRTFKSIQYVVNYYCDTHQVTDGIDPFFATSLIQHSICDEKLSNALAKLLIHLLERGLIKND